MNTNLVSTDPDHPNRYQGVREKPSLVDQLVAMEGSGRRQIELQLERWTERRRLWADFDQSARDLSCTLDELSQPELWRSADTMVVRCIERVVRQLDTLLAGMAYAARPSPGVSPRSPAERLSHALAGDLTLQSITRMCRSLLVEHVTPAGRGSGRIVQIGIELNGLDKVALDADVFSLCLAADRDAVRALLLQIGSCTVNTGALRRLSSYLRKLLSQGLLARLAGASELRAHLARRELENLDARTLRRRKSYRKLFAPLMVTELASSPPPIELRTRELAFA